jgi:hypothetical protein
MLGKLFGSTFASKPAQQTTKVGSFYFAVLGAFSFLPCSFAFMAVKSCPTSARSLVDHKRRFAHNHEVHKRATLEFSTICA